MMAETTIKKSPMEMGIQSGAETHHQLQSITLHSFSVRNIRNRELKKPVPPIVNMVLDLVSDM